MVVTDKVFSAALTYLVWSSEVERSTCNVRSYSIRNKVLVNLCIFVSINFYGVFLYSSTESVEIEIRVVGKGDRSLALRIRLVIYKKRRAGEGIGNLNVKCGRESLFAVEGMIFECYRRVRVIGNVPNLVVKSVTAV